MLHTLIVSYDKHVFLQIAVMNNMISFAKLDSRAKHFIISATSQECVEDFKHPISDFCASRFASKVASTNLQSTDIFSIQDFADCVFNCLRLASLAQGVAQKERSRHDRTNRVGDALTCNIRSLKRISCIDKKYYKAYSLNRG